jgi:hypothetical protein
MFRACKTFLVLTLFLLSGCSSTTFFYNRLDFILPWYLDKYVDLNRASSWRPSLSGTAPRSYPSTYR